MVEWNRVFQCHLHNIWCHRAHNTVGIQRRTLVRAGVVKRGLLRSRDLEETLRTYGILMGCIERKTMGGGEEQEGKRIPFSVWN